MAFTFMQFITLENLDVWVRSFHFGFLNHLKGYKMNILAFLFIELDKAMEDFKKSRCGEVSHKGLILMIFKHVLM